MIRYTFDNRPQRVHIHQGGTLQAYCGLSLQEGDNFVAWEDSLKATCRRCAAHFAPEQSFDDRYNEDRLAGGFVPDAHPCCGVSLRDFCQC